MRTIVLLGVITLIINFGIPYISSTYGFAVKERFIERLNSIPGNEKSDEHTSLTAENLRRWIKAHEFSARGYVFPVLFPLDVLFLLSASCFLGLASVAMAQSSPLLSGFPVWIWWLLPLLYLVSDLSEDTMLAWLFLWPDAIAPSSFSWLQALTFVKIKAIVAAIVQFAGLVVFVSCTGVVAYFRS